MGYNTEQKNLIIKCFEENKDSQLGASQILEEFFKVLLLVVVL